MTTLHIKYLVKKLNSMKEKLNQPNLNDENITYINGRIIQLNTELELKSLTTRHSI
jgi:hypothetical protein